ncbi:MAG: PilW family protein [Bacteriovoracia bacterium]
MPNCSIPTKSPREGGYTLIEVLIAAGLGSFLFFALMSLLGQTTNFAAYFHSSANSIEGSSDAISQLNAIMPQIVRIQSCGCHGTVSTAMSGCTWVEPVSGDPSIGKDPILGPTYAGSNADPGLEIFKGDFESFGGNAPLTGAAGLLGLQTSGSMVGGTGNCETLAGLSGVSAKGCKLQVRLLYKAPVKEAGADASTPGQLKIVIGDQDPSTGGLWIGKSDSRGSTALGISQLSCGFVQSGTTAQSSGMLFALNLKLKTRATTENKPSSFLYESWHPDGKNYLRGTIREVRLKYSFRNIATRGVYQWRAQGKRKCIVNGESAGNKSDCCSLAISSAHSCIACKASGAAASSGEECCSEQEASGVCL